MTRTLNHNITMVGVLIIIAMLAVQTCTHKAEQNNVLVQNNVAKSDSIVTAKKQIDSIAHVKKQLSDVATTLAKNNEQLKDSITTIQQTSDVADVKAEIKINDDAEHLKTDVQLLAAQRDSLIELNRQLATKTLSYRREIAKETTVKTDTIKAKPKPATQFAFGSNMYLPDGSKPNYVLSLSGTTAYSAARNVVSLGGGFDLANKNNTDRLDAYLSRDVLGANRTKKIRFVMAYHKDFAKIYKFKKKK